MALSKKDRRYILKEHPGRSVKELSRELKVKPKDVREVIEAAGLASVPDQKAPKAVQGTSYLGYTPARFLGIMLIVAVVSVVFLNSTRNGFHYDDIHSLTTNPDVRINWSQKDTLKKFYEYFYHPEYFSERPNVAMPRPILMVTFGLNHLLSGYNPWSWLLVNIILHLVNSIIIYIGLCHLTGRQRVALLTALLFAIHPLNTETVNYINCRSESLSGLFMLLTTYFFCRSLREDRLGLRIASFVAFGLGLLTKELVIVVPALVLTIDFLFIHREAPDKISLGRRAVAWYLPLVVIAIVYMGYRQAVLNTLVVERTVRPITDNLIMQARVLISYIRLLFFPVHLNVSYEIVDYSLKDLALLHPTIPRSQALGLYASFLVLAGMAASAVLWMRRRPLISFVIANFFITLSVTSLVPLNAVMNEHRLYLPSFGVALLLAFGLESMAGLIKKKKNQSGSGWPLPVQAVAIAIILLFVMLTVARNFTWHTDLTVWRDSIRKSPLKAQVVCDLGNVYYRTGQKLDRVKGEFREEGEPSPEEADPTEPAESSTGVIDKEERIVIAQTFYVDVDEGPISAEEGKLLDELQQKGLHRAEQLYKWGGRVEPNYYKAWHNLGTINYTYAFLHRRNRANDEAKKYYARAAKYFFRAGTYLRYEGDRFEDLLYAWNYLLGLQERPPFASGESFNDMASTLQQWSELESDEKLKKRMLALALSFYELASQLHPGLIKAHINQARILDALGMSDKAIEKYQQLIEYMPQDPTLRYFRGLSFLKAKRFDEAQRSFQECYHLDPSNQDCLRSIQDMSKLIAVYSEKIEQVSRLLKSGDPEPAIRLCKELIQLGRARIPEPYYFLARGFEQVGQLEGAKKGYERCLDLDASFIDCQKALDQLEQTRKIYQSYLDQAVERFDRGQYPESVQLLFKALDLARGEDAKPYYYLALALLKLGDYSQAEASLKSCLAISPEHVECAKLKNDLSRRVSTKELYHQSLDEGQKLEREGQYESALFRYEQAIKHSGGREPEAYSLLGRTLVKLSRYEEARQAYEQCLALSPADPACLKAIEELKAQPEPAQP